MTLAHVNDEERKSAVKHRPTNATSQQKHSFEEMVLTYATVKNLPHVPSLMRAASGTRLSSGVVIKRCAVASSRAFVRIKASKTTK